MGNFHVFSLDAPAQLRDHKKRRPHQKTKAGCLSCKVKRVKCDQGKPICLRCQRNGLPCSYSASSTQPSSTTVLSSRTRTPTPSGSISQCLSTSLFSKSSPSYGTPPEALLHHFALHWDSIFVLPNLGIPTTFHVPLVELAIGRPHLLRAILSVSAAHLRHHAPDPGRHRLAEHFQQAIALRSFNELISRGMSTLPPDEIGILLLTAILFNLLTLALPADEDSTPGATAVAPGSSEPDPSRSWVFSTRPSRLDWLAVQLGLRELVIASMPYREQATTWQEHEIGEEPVTHAEARNNIESQKSLELGPGVPDIWLEVFALGRQPPKESRKRRLGHLGPREADRDVADLLDNDDELRDFLFREPLILLAEIRDSAPVMSNVFTYLQFLGKLEPEFKTLLYERDPRAMWVFGYWLGLLCRFDYIWWVTRRARRDFMAIVIWLRCSGVTERPGREGLLWTEMVRDLEQSARWDPARERPKSKVWSDLADDLKCLSKAMTGMTYGA